MWIIPKNLNIYHYVQDMGGLILDSQELSDQLEQSVLWRSKPSQSKTWLRRLRRDSSMKHLFSQTLKPSLGNSFMEKWTSSVVASLASHLVSQEENKEIKTQDTFGHTSQMESNDWEDLPLFSLKTFQESSQASSKVKIGKTRKALLFCSMSSESWKDWVIRQRLEYSQRMKLERHTKEKEFLFLVSEMTLNKKVLIMSMTSSSLINLTESQHGQLQENKINGGMSHQESRWATPNTMDHLTPRSQKALIRQATTVRKGRKTPANLREQVDPRAIQVYKQVNWPTPTAGMEMREIGSKIDHFKRRQSLKKQIGLQGVITLDSQKFIGNLNPRWVEMLMGLPIGWTMPSCMNPVIIERMNSDCLEMELCQIQPQKLFELYGNRWNTPTTLDSREHSMRKSYKDRNNGKSRKKEGLSRQVLETFNEKVFESNVSHIQKSSPESKKLLDEFDDCITGFNGKQFVYSSKRILKRLVKDCKQQIKQGLLKKYDGETFENSALIYALEDFHHNFECIKGDYDPIYLEDLETVT